MVEKKHSVRPSAKRWVEAGLFVAVLALGWKWPVLAYCLAINVAVGLAGAIRHGGRHGCGNFCPRGAFYSLLPDTGRKVPPGLLARKTSIGVMLALVAALAAWMRPASFLAWGRLFYVMIAITTGVGLVGWLVFNRFFWCSICPMGKIYKSIRPGRTGIRVADACVKCGLCAKVCPFGFFPPSAADSPDRLFLNPDCMFCRRCVLRCPKGALSVVPATSPRPPDSSQEDGLDSGGNGV